ncbi:hypothetical protein ACWD4G_44385, partial [Streptomyces sp. NPDC002643]
AQSACHPATHLMNHSSSDAIPVKITTSSLNSKHSRSAALSRRNYIEDRQANGVLWEIYEMVRRIERGQEEPGETLEAAHDRLREATRSSLFNLREAMRTDLGVSALSQDVQRPARRSQ